MKRKRILLASLFGDFNMGNRLQNYALQQILIAHDAEVTTIDDYTISPTLEIVIKDTIKYALGTIGIERYKNYIGFKRRIKAIRKFNHINFQKIIRMTKEEAFKANWNDYDLAIAGSDQVWHGWEKGPLELPFYYLQFLPYDKRIAYASSFGFKAFPEADVKQHKEGLSGMRMISCREESGCKLVKELIGKEVIHALDPTLLLSVADWRKLEKQATKFSKTQEHYAFIYFLGKITDEYKDCIKKKVEQKGIRNIIDFMNFKDREISKCNPSDFVQLIDKADYIFTDSFHAVSFSLIFNKEFTVFRRVEQGMEEMFDRIEEILQSKGRLDCIYGGSKRSNTNDFDNLYTKSMQYIDNALKLFEP